MPGRKKGSADQKRERLFQKKQYDKMEDNWGKGK